MSVLFVCTGNICRSPAAEGVFREFLKRNFLEKNVRVDSAGTHDCHVGAAPDRRATAHARKRGYDISGLRARQVTRRDFEAFDLVLAMDHGRGRFKRPRRTATRPCPGSLVARFDLNELRLGDRRGGRFFAPRPAKLHRFGLRHCLPRLQGVGLHHQQSGA